MQSIQWGSAGSFDSGLLRDPDRLCLHHPEYSWLLWQRGKQWFLYCLLSFHLEAIHANFTWISVTNTSHTATSNFKPIGKYLEGGEGKKLLADLVTSTQYWQELGEMESHSILVAVQIGTDSLESKLGAGVKGLQSSSFSSSGNLLLGSRNSDKDCE